MSDQHQSPSAAGDDDLRTLFDAQSAAPSSGIDAAIRSAAARAVQARGETAVADRAQNATLSNATRPVVKRHSVVSLAVAASLVTGLTLWSVLQTPEQPTLSVAEAQRERVIIEPLALDTTTEFDVDAVAPSNAPEVRSAETRSAAKSLLAEEEQFAPRQDSRASAASMPAPNLEMDYGDLHFKEQNTPALQLGVVIKYLQRGEHQQARAAWVLFERRYPLIAVHLDLALLEANIRSLSIEDK